MARKKLCQVLVAVEEISGAAAAAVAVEVDVIAAHQQQE